MNKNNNKKNPQLKGIPAIAIIIAIISYSSSLLHKKSKNHIV